MPGKNSLLSGGDSDNSTIRERLTKFLIKWPLFLFFLILCIGSGFFYNRYTVPKYLSSTQILIKENEENSANATDIIENAVKGKRDVNLNNEILLVKSKTLLEATVAKNNFNIAYYKKGNFLDIEIDQDAQFQLNTDKIRDTGATIEMYLRNIDSNGGEISSSKKENAKFEKFAWNKPFNYKGNNIAFSTPAPSLLAGGEFIVRWYSVKSMADHLAENLSVKPFDSKTSVLELSLKSENLQRGKDVLNKLVEELNAKDEADRAKLSNTTVHFIDERLMVISKELKGVEGNLENYQGTNQIVDMKGQSTQSLDNSNTVSKTIKDLSIQQGIVRMIRDYFANPANANKLVPSSLGLNDETLSSLITRYNDLQLKKEREAPSVAENSTVMQDLNTQLGNLKGSILESLNSVGRNLSLQENSFQEQKSQYSSQLSSIPHNERILQEIKRKQTITEGLYLYLLQKREEAAIASTAKNVTNYKQINLADGIGPVEPKATSIFLYTTLLALFLSFAIIYLQDIMNDKIKDHRDIKSRTSLHIAGDINHIAKRNKQTFAVLGRNMASEQFRLIRSNIYFLLNNLNGKVVMITSTESGEGKSFISLNLAAVCAIPGKKIALLEFDIRKPELSNIFSLEDDEGISEYLSGDIDDYGSIYRSVEDIPDLHIYPCGQIHENPADLLLSERLPHLIRSLRHDYDYIFIDTPPVGIVTDGLILSNLSDLVLYVIRQQTTGKKQLEFLNDLVANKSLRNVSLLFNDIKSKEKKSYSKYYTESTKRPARKTSGALNTRVA
ncbi:GumC family protein [Flavitalea sp.]|nr:polysaccharide biosynthesis tyrosine autokinase [Flavitalea sp.]